MTLLLLAGLALWIDVSVMGHSGVMRQAHCQILQQLGVASSSPLSFQSWDSEGFNYICLLPWWLIWSIEHVATAMTVHQHF